MSDWLSGGVCEPQSMYTANVLILVI